MASLFHLQGNVLISVEYKFGFTTQTTEMYCTVVLFHKFLSGERVSKINYYIYRVYINVQRFIGISPKKFCLEYLAE